MADPITLLVASTAITAGSQIMAGNAAKRQAVAAQKSANTTAKQIDENAANEAAYSQRVALEELRQSELMSSRARALVAHGGGSTTDVGITNLLSRIDNEGKFNAAMALFDGRQRAKGLRVQADVTRQEGQMAYEEGKAKRRASRFGAFNTVLSGGLKGNERGYW